MSKNVVKVQTGFGKEMEIVFVGGSAPYLWVGSDDNYGYINDRSVQKIKKFCDSIIRSKRKKKSS